MSSPPEELMSNLDLISKHPPERREPTKRYVVLYSCCCCCCCCLHTIGGAIGAASGGNFRAKSFSAPSATTSSRKYPSSQWLYWNSFLLTIPVGMFLSTLIFGRSSNPVVITALSIVLLGPVWLLAASVVMALQLALRRDLPAKSLYWRQLGRITGRVILGSLLGMGVMLLLLVLLSILSRFF